MSLKFYRAVTQGNQAKPATKPCTGKCAECKCSKPSTPSEPKTDV